LISLPDMFVALTPP